MNDRQQLRNLLDWVRKGDTVYVHDFSCLARNTKDLLSITIQFTTKKVPLISLKGNLDTSTATGKLMPARQRGVYKVIILVSTFYIRFLPDVISDVSQPELNVRFSGWSFTHLAIRSSYAPSFYVGTYSGAFLFQFHCTILRLNLQFVIIRKVIIDYHIQPHLAHLCRTHVTFL